MLKPRLMFQTLLGGERGSRSQAPNVERGGAQGETISSVIKTAAAAAATEEGNKRSSSASQQN
jgi:hypothetical protein